MSEREIEAPPLCDKPGNPLYDLVRRRPTASSVLSIKLLLNEEVKSSRPVNAVPTLNTEIRILRVCVHVDFSMMNFHR
jgi:hypothetical protein